MDEEDKFVECSVHGKQQETFVCQNIVQSLRDNIPRGFWSAEENHENTRPVFWCNECEQLVNSVGEWNDETQAFAGVTLLCGGTTEQKK